jgi:hypothetical protein
MVGGAVFSDHPIMSTVVSPSSVATDLERAVVGFVAVWQRIPPGRVQVELRPLSRGLEAAGVYDVRALCTDDEGRLRHAGLVVKRLGEAGARELAAHAAAGDAGIAPKLLGVEPLGAGEWLACLERVRAWRAPPR